MKTWFYLGLYFFTGSAWAYHCPTEMTAQQEELRKWFEPLRGTYEIRNCRVEITVCAPESGEEANPIVAEVYIVDHRGREAYLPLNLADSQKISARAEFYRRTLFYIKRDKYYETEFGRTETSRLQIVLDENGIKSLDLGMYATNKRLRGPSASRWYNCGFNAE